jgi:hypothetical protein
MHRYGNGLRKTCGRAAGLIIIIITYLLNFLFSFYSDFHGFIKTFILYKKQKKSIFETDLFSPIMEFVQSRADNSISLKS